LQISQKAQYVLRALFELAKRQGHGPVSASVIADTQAIPHRFLELILQSLRAKGLVDSRRGIGGGYLLAVDPKEISVADIIRLVDGSLSPVLCKSGRSSDDCPLIGKCPFKKMWLRAKAAAEIVYSNTSLADIVEDEKSHTENNENLCLGNFQAEEVGPPEDNGSLIQGNGQSEEIDP